MDEKRITFWVSELKKFIAWEVDRMLQLVYGHLLFFGGLLLMRLWRSDDIFLTHVLFNVLKVKFMNL
jgi:hypothetical protein